MKPFINNEYINWLTPFFKPYWGRVFMSAIIVIIRSVLLLSPPLLTRHIIDRVLPSHEGTILLLFSVCIVAVPTVTGMLIILDLYISTFVLRVASKIRSILYDGLQRRPLGWFQNTKIGDLLNRALDETQEVALFAYQGIGSLIWVNSTIIVGIGIIVWIDWVIAACVSSILFLQAIIVNKLGRYVETNAKSLSEANSSLVEYIRETVSGIEYIKYTGKEDYAIERMTDLLDNHFKFYRVNLINQNLFNTLKSVFSGFTIAFVYYFGGLRVMDGIISVGSLVAIISIYVWLVPAIGAYQILYSRAKQVTPLLRRIREILYIPSKTVEKQNPDRPIELTVKDVSFGYENKNILCGINLNIHQGETVLIVGKSGGGKSTLADILIGLEKPNTGQVLFNGMNIDQISVRWLRKNVLCVSQDTQLISGTLKDNLLYAHYSIDEVEIREALRVAELEEWVNTLPNGLETYLGERSVQISGGERQRIGIARAILHKPSILILDESTSALDKITELKVIHNLQRHLSKVTLLIISHRLSIAEKVNKIVVLNDGKIVGCGNHNDLILTHKYYKSLYFQYEEKPNAK